MYNNFYEIHYVVIWILLVTTLLGYFSGNDFLIKNRQKKKKTEQYFLVLFFCIIIALFMGGRPPTENFGDTQLYVGSYENGILPYENEPVFNAITRVCLYSRLSTFMYLTTIAFLYVFLPAIFLIKRTSQPWIGFLFFISSFSFLGYGVNGVRNGLATSLFILSFCWIKDVKLGLNRLFVILFISLLSIGIHRSLLLPSVCLLLSIYVVRDIKYAFLIWVLSIPISFLFGASISSVFVDIGYDDRLEGYLAGDVNSHGFRWDFILYSIMPILLGMILYKRKIKTDVLYNVMLKTYILCNALWIIIIRANFSNRFAYLSWFLYPLMIYYPIFHFRIWKKQNRKCATILILYFAFTFVMYKLGK